MAQWIKIQTGKVHHFDAYVVYAVKCRTEPWACIFWASHFPGSHIGTLPAGVLLPIGSTAFGYGGSWENPTEKWSLPALSGRSGTDTQIRIICTRDFLTLIIIYNDAPSLFTTYLKIIVTFLLTIFGMPKVKVFFSDVLLSSRCVITLNLSLFHLHPGHMGFHKVSNWRSLNRSNILGEKLCDSPGNTTLVNWIWVHMPSPQNFRYYVW